eukprot:RCo029658
MQHSCGVHSLVLQTMEDGFKRSTLFSGQLIVEQVGNGTQHSSGVHTNARQYATLGLRSSILYFGQEINVAQDEAGLQQSFALQTLALQYVEDGWAKKTVPKGHEPTDIVSQVGAGTQHSSVVQAARRHEVEEGLGRSRWFFGQVTVAQVGAGTQHSSCVHGLAMQCFRAASKRRMVLLRQDLIVVQVRAGSSIFGSC